MVSQALTVKALCPVFGECGGCTYQDIPYSEELKIKENRLKELFFLELGPSIPSLDPIVPSPEPYHYRSRLDLALIKTRSGETFLGFMPRGRYHVLPVDSCSIAKKEISSFLPKLKTDVDNRLPGNYRTANIVVKTGDDGRVFWGGIGRRSLELEENHYLWTRINDMKIYYSLDTFFQANLSILPKLIDLLLGLIRWQGVHFYDLYAGVGVFGCCLANKVDRVTLIEDNKAAVKLARFNILKNELSNVEIFSGRVEDLFFGMTESSIIGCKVVFVDPPRSGLKPKALEAIGRNDALDRLFYLSCDLQSLLRDLKGLSQWGWIIERISPFDFFPKTIHLETLVMLRRKESEWRK